MSNLYCISPLDGRYANQLTAFNQIFSEFALIKNRLLVEVEWLIALANNPTITHIKKFNDTETQYLLNITSNFSLEDAAEVKKIEEKTKHDVKAVEYFLKNKLKQHETLNTIVETVHFAMTSEDTNSLAYALMLQQAMQKIIQPSLESIIQQLKLFIKQNKDISILARTHGQPASPTTLGREAGVFLARLIRQYQQLLSLSRLAKCNGAVGNYNAHYLAYPDLNWPCFVENFIQSLGLTISPVTTQIEPHDNIAEHADVLARINMILIDLCEDFWTYISLNYLKHSVNKDQVGSSTMPHKINPIDFENAEGNLGIANALLNHFASKLTKSRLQRDLSDSTVMRNLGVALGHCHLSYQSLCKGLTKIQPNETKITEDLDNNWQVLTEAVQTIMRKNKIDNAYEQLKELSQGKLVTQDSYLQFVNKLKIDQKSKTTLLQLTPNKYIGNAQEIMHIIAKIETTI